MTAFPTMATNWRAAFARMAMFLLVCLSCLGQRGWAASSESDTAISYHPVQAIAQARSAYERARAAGDRPGQIAALRQHLWAEVLMFRDPGLIAAEAEQRAREWAHAELLCEATIGKGVAAMLANDREAAIALFDQAARMAERGKWPHHAAKIELMLGNVHLDAGMVSEALHRMPRAYKYFESQGDTVWMVESLGGTADVYFDSKDAGDRAKAADYFQQALRLLDPKVHRLQMLKLYLRLGMAKRMVNQLTEARAYFDQALALAKAMQEDYMVAELIYRLSGIDRAEGRMAAALTKLEEAEQVFRQNGKPERLALIYLTRAQVLAAMNRKKESLELLRRAEEAGKAFKSSTWDAAFYDAAAELYGQLGEYQQAFSALQSVRVADARVADIANNKLAAELKLKFDVKFQEQENALLRARQQEADARRVALFSALGLCIALLGVGGVYLFYQIRLKRRFLVLAMRDDLTGLPNRRNILEVARLQFEARVSRTQAFCLAILDIDHFKAINDSFGHDVGDVALAAFANTCRSQLRNNDQLGRFGGEEFLLVLPDTDASQVGVVFERIRDALRAVAVAGAPADYRLSFSMGVAEARKTDTVDDLIKRADLALYRAKQAGRTCYEVALPLEAGIESATPETRPAAEPADKSRWRAYRDVARPAA